TPARTITHASVLNTWKYANNNYHVEMKKTQKNIPSFGRAKEIAPESEFECFIITEKPLNFVKWIRLGKWSSKAKVTTQKLSPLRQREGIFSYPYPLNPLDVMFTHQVIRYDVINMPPVSLIRNVQLKGQYYEIKVEGQTRKLPACMEYRFN
ncbi:MAG: type I-D CRISPR-associated protein Cas5/Csc1, partial [Kamptonema sp. SIO4C4]|nr:type I-D CRISPR-associated protein Cas5/Csc1 [Kamptonema sp. SIO4C4]